MKILIHGLPEGKDLLHSMRNPIELLLRSGVDALKTQNQLVDGDALFGEAFFESFTLLPDHGPRCSVEAVELIQIDRVFVWFTRIHRLDLGIHKRLHTLNSRASGFGDELPLELGRAD